MFCGYLKQSTTVTISLGPALDDDDALTEKTGLTIEDTDIYLSKNGAAKANPNDTNDCTEDANGVYLKQLDATDTGTLGILTVYCHYTDVLYLRQDYMVVKANWYDTMCSTDYLQTDVKEVNGTAQTAGDVVALANSSAAWGYINSGVVFRGVASAGDTTHFTCGGLAGQGAGAFVDASTPWYAYVFNDAGGAGAAPQGETRTISAYNNATGEFTVSSAFTAAIASGDNIIVMSGRLAAVTEIKSVVDDILDDTAEIGAAGVGLTEAGGDGDHLTNLPEVDADIKKINGTTVNGDGSATPWGP